MIEKHLNDQIEKLQARVADLMAAAALYAATMDDAGSPAQRQVVELQRQVKRLRAKLAAAEARATLAETERDDAKADAIRLAGLVREVMADHRDTEDSAYNGCRADPCMWCAEAAVALTDKPEGATND